MFFKESFWKLMVRCVGPVVARSTEDPEVRRWNPTRAQRKFLRAQEMNLQGSIRPRCDLVDWAERAVSVQVRYSWAPLLY